jgi:predicted nucleotidyltransferase component of viral defense system
MNKLLAMDDDRRRQIFEQTSAQMNLAEVAVEKDFWVCWTLDKLFRLPCGQHLTFKGGTSLSKAWHLIERFSEDIDITIHRDALGFGGDNAPHAAPSKTQRRKRLKQLKAACERYIAGTLATELYEVIVADLPKENAWSLQLDADDSQTLLFEYPSVFPVQAEYLRRWVKIEMGGRADVEPSDNVVIQSYVAEAFPDLLSNTNVNVRAIRPERTFWEKALLLHEEGFRPDEKQRKAGMARHYYDLFRMIQADVGAQAAVDMELFSNIAQHREHYFQYAWVDYESYQPGQLRIVPVDEQLANWKADYSSMQAEMFFGEVPAFEDIIDTVRQFQDSFNGVAD